MLNTFSYNLRYFSFGLGSNILYLSHSSWIAAWEVLSFQLLQTDSKNWSKEADLEDFCA